VRLGTAAVTTLGMRSLEMKEVARVLGMILRAIQPETCSRVRYRLDDGVRQRAIARVGDLLIRYPAYPGIQL
jgi:glycine hydroxymethyltransferase